MTVKQSLSAQEMQKRSAEVRWRKISPEQRSEMMRKLARKSATARRDKFSKEQRSEMMRKLAHRRWAAVDAKKG